MASKLEENEQQITREIVKHILRGAYRSTAAACAGVTLPQLNKWLRKGVEGKQPYRRFMVALDTAEAEVEALMTQALMHGAKKDWRAAGEFLRIRFREKFGRVDVDLKKKLQIIVDIMAEEVPHKTFVRIMLRAGNRSTLEEA